MIDRPAAAPASWGAAGPGCPVPCPSTGARPAAVVLVLVLLALGLAAGDLRSLLVVAIGVAIPTGSVG